MSNAIYDIDHIGIQTNQYRLPVSVIRRRVQRISDLDSASFESSLLLYE